MDLNQEQKDLITQIANLQTRDIITILLSQQHVGDIVDSVRGESYEITTKEVTAELRSQIKQWAKVKRDPENFSKLLDAGEKGWLRHHIFDYYSKHGNTRGLWKKLNLDEKINQNLN